QGHLDHVRVELAAGALAEPAHRLAMAETVAIGPIAGHRVIRVADEDDARLERDVLAGDAVGVALAVPALVAVTDDRPDDLEAVDRGDDPFAELGMRL